MDIENKLLNYIDALNELNEIQECDYVFKLTINKSYARISKVDNYGKGQESAYAFVTLTNKKFPVGSILKPASWKTPALNFVRGSIMGTHKEYNLKSVFGL